MTAQKTEIERDQLHALNLAKECYSMKMSMPANSTVIDDVVRFVVNNQNTSFGKKKEIAQSHYFFKKCQVLIGMTQ